MDITTAVGLGPKNKPRKRVGRGSGSGLGKTSGRGRKGAGSRRGKAVRMLFLGGDLPLFRHLPKRGFSNTAFETRYIPVNVGRLEEFFQNGDVVDPAALEAKRVVGDSVADRQRDKVDGGTATVRSKLRVKILGDGELTKKLTVRLHAASKSAIEKIEKAGGKFEALPQPKTPVRNKTGTAKAARKAAKIASVEKNAPKFAKAKAAKAKAAAPAAAAGASSSPTTAARLAKFAKFKAPVRKDGK